MPGSYFSGHEIELRKKPKRKRRCFFRDSAGRGGALLGVSRDRRCQGTCGTPAQREVPRPVYPTAEILVGRGRGGAVHRVRSPDS